MTIQEMIDACKSSIQKNEQFRLMIAKEWTGSQIHIGDHRSPRSKRIEAYRPGQTVAWFEPREVLEWIRYMETRQ